MGIKRISSSRRFWTAVVVFCTPRHFITSDATNQSALSALIIRTGVPLNCTVRTEAMAVLLTVLDMAVPSGVAVAGMLRGGLKRDDALAVPSSNTSSFKRDCCFVHKERTLWRALRRQGACCTPAGNESLGEAVFKWRRCPVVLQEVCTRWHGKCRTFSPVRLCCR